MFSEIGVYTVVQHHVVLLRHYHNYQQSTGGVPRVYAQNVIK